MISNDNETIVEKVVNFVKDAVGVRHADEPSVAARPEHRGIAEGIETVTRPIGDTDAERLRREVGEYPRERVASDLSATNLKPE